MIVRETDSGFLVIEQHEHGKIAGEFARNLSSGVVGGRLTERVLRAIANHDRAWQASDAELPWDEQEKRPYSFLDHPPEPKTTAYTRFLDGMESTDPYASLLCSAHYGSLVEGSEDPHECSFASREKDRRERLRRLLPESVLGDFDRDFAVLQFSDDLSLFVCLNEPGRADHPWYVGGVRFRGEKLRPRWDGDPPEGPALSFEPDPFDRSFTLRIPYRTLRDGEISGDGVYEIHVRGPRQTE